MSNKTDALRFDAFDTFSRLVDENGFLKADANLTRIGIFTYRRGDGSTVRELRPPEEVFAEKSLKTFQMLPITNEHPITGRFDSKDVRSIGQVGENLATDGDFVRARVMITDTAARDAILSGKKTQLSCGYLCDVENTPGIWRGHSYDAVQRNIRGNHVALVARGRAGPDVRVKLDNDDGIGILDGTLQFRNEDLAMTKLKIDGLDFEVSEPAAQAIEKERAANAAALATAKADAEKATAKADASEMELKKSNEALAAAIDPAKLGASVKSRVALEKKAGEILGADTKLDAMSDDEVKKAVVKKLAPETKLDDKSADYVGAFYEAALAMAPKRSPLAGVRVVAANVKVDVAEAGAAEKARAKMMEDQRGAYLKFKESK